MCCAAKAGARKHDFGCGTLSSRKLAQLELRARAMTGSWSFHMKSCAWKEVREVGEVRSSRAARVMQSDVGRHNRWNQPQ